MKYIKLLIPFLLITLLSMSSFAQESTAKWLTNYEEALAVSKKESKPILMNFSGSDWCANCMRLEKVVFSSNAFKTFSDKNFVLLKVDFPAKQKNKLSPEMTKQNDGLAEKFNKINDHSELIDGNKVEELLENVKNFDIIYPSIGENMSFLKKMVKEKKLNLNFITRDEDIFCWNFSNKGYFNFKSNIPKILAKFQLN